METVAWIPAVPVILLSLGLWLRADASGAPALVIAVSLLMALQLWMLGHAVGAVMAGLVILSTLFINGPALLRIGIGSALGLAALWLGMERLEDADLLPIIAWFFGMMARDPMVNSGSIGSYWLSLTAMAFWLAFGVHYQFWSFVLSAAVPGMLIAVSVVESFRHKPAGERIHWLFH